MRLRTATIALALAALALPAEAQRVRDHRGGQGQVKVKSRRPPKQEISVSGFAPRTGPVGTRVTVTGNGFLKQTRVVVGGRPVRAESQSATAIVFVFPPRHGDGTVVLRHPGAANDVLVGRFLVEADPRIVRIAPESGPAGTRVEIRGDGFRAGDQVLFNNRQLPLAELSAERIVTSVPQGATTDYFEVVRPASGKRARAPRPFTVALPPPVISGFAPTSGPPGSIVRISGSSFAPEDNVFYGRVHLPVQNRGAGWLDVVIPPRARRNEVFTVRGPRGSFSTPNPFVVVLPPTIFGFEPKWGPAGSRVELRGANFLRGDEIRFNGRPLRVVAFDDSRLTVEIPPGARTDSFLLFRGGTQQAASSHAFEVLVAPAVTGFAPAGGPGGTRVTIAGSGFGTDAVVMYGAMRLRPEKLTDTSIEVTIPPRASSQPFLVRTRGGEAKSARPFQVYVYSTIASISPTSGPVGTRVWIRGRDFSPTDVFYLNNLTLAIVERQPQGYQVQIPPGATSGPIAWDSYGVRQTSRFRFEVLQPPQLTSFAPLSGPTGTQVTLDGANLDAGTAVFYGNLPCTVVRRAPPRQIVAVIPPNAVGTEYLWVDNAGQRVRSTQPFQVITPPVITGFAPASGPSGTQITLTGAHLTPTSVVLFGNLRMPVLRKALPTQLVVTVPVDARGSDYIWIDDHGQRVRSPTMFTVVTAHAVTGLSPLSGPTGTQVTISGERFTPGARVWFGALACPIIGRPTRTRIVVAIPTGAAGSQPLVVEDNGQRTASAQAFAVTAAPQWPDGTPHEHAHQHPHPLGDHHHHPHAHPHRQGTNHHHPY